MVWIIGYLHQQLFKIWYMSFLTVTESNAEMVALQAYDNPQCLSMDEFHEDYRGFLYIQRLCRRYSQTKKINERLAINHLVTLVNVFGPTVTVRLLFLKCSPRLWKIVKTLLIYINLLPIVVLGVNGSDIYTESIPIDVMLQQKLQAL